MYNTADAEGSLLPIKLDSTSNGEFEPIPLEPVHHQAKLLAHKSVDIQIKRLNMNRRKFLVSACGAATTLLAFNRAYAGVGKTGGFYEIPAEAALEMAAAREFVEGDEFIFDVQGHFVDPKGKWLESVPAGSNPFSGMPKTRDCELTRKPGDRNYLHCLGPDEFLKDVFLDSDTHMMVLSFVPSAPDKEPLTIEEAAATREIVAKMEGSHRLLLHGRVNPNQDADLARMEQLAEQWRISAWKTYTQFGPGGQGFFMTDDVGHAFIEKARKLGVKNICIHKGIPFGRQSYEHSLCSDIGPIARQYPDVNFLIYHSGFIPGQPEGPFDPKRGEGIDLLIQSVLENGKPGNVFAELGSTWRALMRDPDSAAHTLGKLFKHLGPDKVLWGTDSIWYGSPQDQIQAFRTFQISEELREKHGYPRITPELRAGVFGLNAAGIYGISVDEIRQRSATDKVGRERLAYRENPSPHFRTRGPKTRREFLNLLARSGGIRP